MRTQIAVDVVCEPGGFVTTDQRDPVDWMNAVIRKKLIVTGGPGCGMLFVLKELILQVVASGRPVRVLDYGGNFKDLCHSLDGLYYAEHWPEDMWMDPNNAIVMVDWERIPKQAWPSILGDVTRTPLGLWVLAVEGWIFDNNSPRADVLASMDLKTANGRQLQADAWIYGSDNANRLPAELCETDRIFLSGDRDRFATHWVLIDGESHHHVLMTPGPKRGELFARRAAA